MPVISGVSKKELAWVVIVLLAFYVFVPQLKSFAGSLHLLTHPGINNVIFSSIFIVATFIFAALTYSFLSRGKIPFSEEFIIQVAAMFVNRLLPAGIGGIGANYAYLRHKRVKTAEAASMVAMNNIMGVFAHLMILVITVLFFAGNNTFQFSGLKHGIRHILVIGSIVLIVGVIILLSLRLAKIKSIVNDFLTQISSYRFHPYLTGLALFSQLGLSVFNILSLSFSAKAVNIDLSFAAILIVYSLGALISHFVPTPGGLGGFEAGLAAGLVAYGVDKSSSLAAVLLYRIISYWAPLVLGALAFIYVQKQNWLSASKA